MAALPHDPPELVEEFVAYHKENGGVSRYEKLKYYFDEKITPGEKVYNEDQLFKTIYRYQKNKIIFRIFSRFFGWESF